MGSAMGWRSALLAALVAYVVLDLCSPLVPGAFSFDPAESVDAVGAFRARPGAPRIVPAAPDLTAAASAQVVPLRPPDASPVVSRRTDWRPHAVVRHVVTGRPRSAEDG
jgi:hypothetical protein